SDQGIRSRPLFWHLSPLRTNPIVPTDLERCRESEQGRRQIFEVEADLGVRGRLWPHVKTSPRHAAKRSLSSSTQTIELAIDGGRGFTSPFPPPAKRHARQRDPAFARDTYLFGTVLMVA